MLYLESFLHRVKLAEIVSRWIMNKPRNGDVETLKRVLNLNSYIARIWVDRLATRLLNELHGEALMSFPAKTKGDLKDFLVEHHCADSPRIEEMFARYRRFPEDFYRETPFDARVYFVERQGQSRFVGSTRIKRFRRIAEKGSRRIVDFMFERVRANADALAEERARAEGVTKAELITPHAMQVEEFRHAERRLLKAIRRGTIHSELPVLSIPDVVGIKVLASPTERNRLIDIINADPSCKLLEQEHHTGFYVATNLRVAHHLPREVLGEMIPNDLQQQVLASRGLDPTRVAEQYVEFLATGEDHVLLEVIVSDYEELLESEIGRSMHEDRIVKQRASIDYTGHLAVNVAYLMEYMLTVCLAPTSHEIDDVPIKLWVKYVPDTVERLTRQLFELPVDASLDSPVVTNGAAVDLARKAKSRKEA